MGQNERIWAPWRLEYVQATDSHPGNEESEKKLRFPEGADPECFICQAVADDADRARYVVGRCDKTIAILNRFPYNNGHLLIAPTRHLARLDQLSADDHTAIMERITYWIGILEQTIFPHGFNVGLNLGRVAGAGVPGHLHWHIVPRWNGDTNFMPTLAGVKVIPQSLDSLWEMLVLKAKSE